ncbi:MAG: CHAD domain-containing protein [Christensenellales bacterium]|jgi:phosphohistidine phosphatase SixA/CHAD domain-containing protein
MQVVFVRHAAAQDHAAGLDDISRELTPKGIAAFQALMPQLKERLQCQPVSIWSSPAARALGTALILRSALGIDSMQTHDWIYLGDDAALAYALMHAGEEIVLIVGHQPHLSDWSEALTGQYIPYRKGDMVCLELSDNRLRDARLLWRIERGSAEAAVPGADNLSTPLTPETDAPAEAESAPSFPALTPQRCSTALLAMLRNAGKWRRRFLKDPEASKPPHQLRISLRKARSLLSFLKPLIDQDNYRACQAALKGLSDSLAHIRQLDVLIAYLRTLRSQKKGAASLKALSTMAKGERHHEALALQVRLAADAFDEAILISTILAGRFSETLELENFPAFAEKRSNKWQQRILNTAHSLNLHDHNAAHKFRLLLKKWHNAAALLQLPYAMEVNPAQLKQWQDDLGDICDTYANAALAEYIGTLANDPALGQDIVSFLSMMEAQRAGLLDQISYTLSSHTDTRAPSRTDR